jgi:hypothetical protein
MTRADIVQRVLNERVRHFDLPGRELDVGNTPNDWVAIVGRYLFEETRRGAVKPVQEDFEDSLVKAAAVILAALEHCSHMEKNGHFDVHS